MVAKRYKFYVLVVRTISHSFAALTCEILFLRLEHKIHIFLPPCNVLYIHRILLVHGCVEIWNFSLSVEKYPAIIFTSECSEQVTYFWTREEKFYIFKWLYIMFRARFCERLISANPGLILSFQNCDYPPRDCCDHHFVALYLDLGVNTQQHFTSSSYMFLDTRTLPQI